MSIDHLEDCARNLGWSQMQAMACDAMTRCGDIGWSAMPTRCQQRSRTALQGTAARAVKQKVLRQLKPAYTDLACRAAPSRLVEALFVWGDLDDKEVIAEALVAEAPRLQVRTATSHCTAGHVGVRGSEPLCKP
jgi:hypothetical protein